MGPGMGGGARRSGPRGASGAGAPTGAQARGQRPRASGSPGFACPSVGWSVCLRPRAAGPCRVPGKARPAHLQPPAPGKRDRGAATRVFLVGLLASSRATGTLGDRSWELSKKPAPLPLSPPRPPPPSPIPERSSRSLAAGRLAASAGGRRGRRRRGGRKEGCPLWGWGKRGEGAALSAAPPCRQPRELGTLAVRLACCHLAPIGFSASREGIGLQGSGASGSELRGALGAWWKDVEGKRESPGGKGGTAGVLYRELGVVVGRRHPPMTTTKKKW